MGSAEGVAGEWGGGGRGKTSGVLTRDEVKLCRMGVCVCVCSGGDPRRWAFASVH